MKKTLAMVLGASMLLMSSCASTNQFYGAATGASLGGMFGSAIGAVTGGWRGSNLGTIAGMALGGVIGAAATSPKVNKENRTSDYYNGYDYGDYRQNNSYSPYSSVHVENIRLAETVSNNCIDAGEHAKLIFEIRNMGSEYVYDIAPVITVSGTKQIYLSPTAIISELGPGRAVRYQAEVVATNKLKNGVADFNISFSNGDQLYTVSSFQIATRGR